MKPWPADESVFSLVEKVKKLWHLPRLAEANIAVSMADTKPFVNERFNWGKTTKFSNSAKVWHPENKRYDFLITLSINAWDILITEQKEALIDLHLNCMQIEYEIEMVEKDGKKKPAKDKWGRKVYTETPKMDEDGNYKWKVFKLDLPVIQYNIARYGCWCQDLIDLNSAIKDSENRKLVIIKELKNDSSI